MEVFVTFCSCWGGKELHYSWLADHATDSKTDLHFAIVFSHCVDCVFKLHNCH